MPHEFLSEGWIDAALELRAEYLDRVPVPELAIKMNQIITKAPFGDDPIEMHLDTTDGIPLIDRGHLADADVTITTDYDTAKALFVSGDQTAAMQAFMSGKIMVEGDVAKMMMVQANTASRSDLQEEIGQRLQELTAD